MSGGHTREGKFVTLCRDYERRLPQLSQKQRAEIEDEIWEHAPDRITRTKDGKREFSLRVKWFAQRFDETTHGYDKRHRIFGSIGEDLLWERIDQGMTLSTAIKMLTEARKLAGQQANGKPPDVEAALRQVFVDYDKLSFKRVLADGRVIRQHRPATKLKDNSFKARWARIRAELADYADERLASVDEDLREPLKREFENEIKIVMEEFRGKVGTAAARRADLNKRSMASVRRRLNESFEILRLTPPKKGQPINIKKVKKQKHKMSRLYHPDHVGDDSMREHYEEVVEAATFIEDVYCQFGGNA